MNKGTKKDIHIDHKRKHLLPEMFKLTSPRLNVSAQTVDFVSNLSLAGWVLATRAVEAGVVCVSTRALLV